MTFDWKEKDSSGPLHDMKIRTAIVTVEYREPGTDDHNIIKVYCH